jgi:hypothetical protein
LKRGGGSRHDDAPTSPKITRSSSRHQLATPVNASISAGSASSPSKSKANGTPTPLPLGTRLSRRFRNVDDEWQQVPKEWLTPADTTSSASKNKAEKGKGKRKPKEVDEESELSELTDEEEHEARLRASNVEEPEQEEAEKGLGDETPLTPLESPASEVNGTKGEETATLEVVEQEDVSSI